MYIDPVIKEVVEELKIKNPPSGEDYETAQLHRAFPDQDATGITERLAIINKWYDSWTREKWFEVKSYAPDLTAKVHKRLTEIDTAFEKFKAGKKTWAQVEGKIDAYAESWREISIAFPL